MFDFAWSEIALIGVVALVLIGPKDMPVAIKAVSGMIRKARKMASEFQGHVDEMVKDTSIAEVRQQINEIRNFDIRGEIEKAVDSDHTLRSAFNDPFHSTSTPASGVLPEIDAPATTSEPPPAFIPPETPVPASATAESSAAPPVVPPAFIPPGVVRPEPDSSMIRSSA